jgi:VanZ family protein
VDLCPYYSTTLFFKLLKISYVLVGLVALCIAVADEVYQSFIPFRVGSFTDFLLDGTGIFLAMLIFGQVSVFGSHRRIRRFSKFPLPHYPV